MQSAMVVPEQVWKLIKLYLELQRRINTSLEAGGYATLGAPFLAHLVMIEIEKQRPDLL